ncbi:phosphoribosyl-ATP pyrophosphohydrolase/phosphoribosyl-AMP cyclohydrolase [Filimonas zeae]|uniref:Histidine biosynthesis bifunctional protein HisIE n=1 Tax=Filimonas zeae TaxID=1737353 RepID=A0A917IXJ5_9BACT|nr:bifunctional phosphoribosyl-AMP cyclohydrolase/phosphoribosyl-ATP diphosphatase HisIE [Filimonas zeae]MDR6338496.1 phosphoribosyl-ATP pyrophosphohydrolase/phosphoribosyl-AMP cyclohydrolase [Filimonas zeae]GGH67986.1 histidine biosynthesis bifunctional protein HisIE [Filimonas zeae]
MKAMNIDFNKYADGLVPAVIQDANTRKVLMLGFMNQEALDTTEHSGRVTFYSRSKQRLWTKGEESGNFLMLKEILLDCDDDTLLIKVEPMGPVCHTGADTCWNETNDSDGFLEHLEKVIQQRRHVSPDESYVAKLFQKGLNKIAQKVGEEAVEVVIEAKDNNDHLFKNEAADLLFHYLILLNAKGFSLKDITAVLQDRQK